MTAKHNNEFNIQGSVGAIFSGDNATGQTIHMSGSNQNQDELLKAFEKISQKIDALQGSEKEDAKLAVRSLTEEAQKGNGAEEKVVQRWFNFLFEAAPDVWEVAVNTFINPIQGVHTVFQKVAERAKASRSTSR